MVGIIAHRGGSGLRVENTLAAFANAIVAGAAGAELDVRLSADGQVVVHHDSHLNPDYCLDADGNWLRSDRKVAIADLSYESLLDFDIGTPRPGSSYAERFDLITAEKGQRIPLLRDVIRLVRNLSDSFFLIIEIKVPVLDGTEEERQRLVDSVLSIIEQENFGDRFRLCSFDWRALLYAKRQRSATRTWFTTHPLSWYGEDVPPAEDLRPASKYIDRFRQAYRRGAPWLGDRHPDDLAGGFAEAIAAAGGEAWFMYHSDCKTSRVETARQHGLISAAWSVNLCDPKPLAMLANVGVDWSCVDYPGCSF